MPGSNTPEVQETVPGRCHEGTRKVPGRFQKEAGRQGAGDRTRKVPGKGGDSTRKVPGRDGDSKRQGHYQEGLCAPAQCLGAPFIKGS